MTKRMFLVLCAASMFVSTVPARAADKVTLMLNWYLYSEHAPFFYGKEKGLYAKHGIDLDIQEGRGSGVTTQAIGAKSADFGYVDVATMMRAAVKGAPVVAVGVALQTSPQSVISFCDKNIKKPADLKGKVVATTPGDAMSQIWPLFLKKNGLQESELEIVSGDATTKLNAVINGRADVVLGHLNDQNLRMKDATGKEACVMRFADYGINLVNAGIIANHDTVKGKPDLVKRFMAANTEAFDQAIKNPAAAAQSMLNASPKAGKFETLKTGFEMTIPLFKDPTGKSKQVFRVSDQNMKETVEAMVEYGGLDAKARTELKTYYTNEYLPK